MAPISSLKDYMRQHRARLVVFGLAVILIGGFFMTAGISSLTPPAHAQTTPTPGLSGWAWSDNVGWICFFKDATYCPGANVSANASGALTGYAWSDSIGWIQFGGLSGFPSGSGTTAANAKVSGSTLTGWVRAPMPAATPVSFPSSFNGLLAQRETDPQLGDRQDGPGPAV